MLASLLAAIALGAGPETSLGGSVSSDLRYRPSPVAAGSWYQPLDLPAGFTRNQNTLNLRGRVRSNGVGAVVDLDLVYTGFAQEPAALGDLSERDRLDPFRIEAHSLYVEARDLGLKGLDLRLGQQLVQHGVGDQFNPTNHLNADDLEDPLRFGDQLGNLMARVDYSPRGNWTATLAVVPVFKPALLPETAPVGFASSDVLPMEEAELRWRIHSEAALAEEALGYPTIVGGANPELPETSLANAQLGVNLGGHVGLHDLAVSYYRGIHDFPVAVANHTVSVAGEQCNPDDAEDCIDGLLVTEATLAYPHMQAFGFNAAGEIGLFDRLTSRVLPIGYRVEVALILPEQQTITLTQDDLDLGFIQYPAGEYDYGLDGDRPVTLSDTPFLKWVVGLDYSFGRHIYINAQWVHGLPDEFGAGAAWQPERWVVRSGGVDTALADTTRCALNLDGETCAWEITRPRIGDYLVVGADLMWGENTLRLFGILDLVGVAREQYAVGGRERIRYHALTSEGFSAVLYPELMRGFGNGLELGAGALILLGQPHTRFGDPAAGGTQVFARGRYSF